MQIERDKNIFTLGWIVYKNGILVDNFQITCTLSNYRIHRSSLSQFRMTYTRNPKQSAAANKIIIIWTHREETNASARKAFHNQYQKREKTKPTAAPTTTWLVVWSCCATNHESNRRYTYKIVSLSMCMNN